MDLLESNIEAVKSAGMVNVIPDADIMAHFDELDRYGLKGTEWRQLPVDNPEHDFVTPLLSRYLDDLNERKDLSTHGKPRFVDLIRK
jgi:hypothetical protein